MFFFFFLLLCFLESESESEPSESEEEKGLGSSRLHQVRPKTRVTRSHRSKNRKRGVAPTLVCCPFYLDFNFHL